MHSKAFIYSDDELVKMLKEDEHDAFGLIYKRHAGNLFRACYNINRNKAECEDVIQELFAELWLKKSTLHVTTSLKGYLFTAAKNRILMKIRSQKITVDLDQIAELTNYQTTDDLVMEKELKLCLQKEIAHLPVRCSEIFKLSRNQQLSNKEIASQLNLSIKTVENQITIAIKRLRNTLSDFSIFLLINLISLFFGG